MVRDSVDVRGVPSPRYAERPSSIKPPADDHAVLEKDRKAVVLQTPDREDPACDVYVPPNVIIDIKPTVESLAAEDQRADESLDGKVTVERKQMRVRSTCFLCHDTISSRTPSIEFSQYYWTRYNNHGSAKVRMHIDCVTELDKALDTVWDDTDVLLADVL